jgi:NAD(P)H dehydrogenase (quinone)
MNVLIVYAHHEPKSFSHAMLETARETLIGRGHDVVISDLYEMAFEATATRADFRSPVDEKFLKYSREQYHASVNETLAADIAAELEKLRRSDLLILHFPLWWFSLPAIIKGWVDRVFAMGAVYDGRGAFFERGHMAGRRGMVVTTTGGPPVMYSPSGMCGDMESVLWPIQNGILRFVGFDVLPPVVIHGVDISDSVTLEGYLQHYRSRLLTVEEDKPLFFHPMSDYGADLHLLPEVVARTPCQWNPRAEK